MKAQAAGHGPLLCKAACEVGWTLKLANEDYFWFGNQ